MMQLPGLHFQILTMMLMLIGKTLTFVWGSGLDQSMVTAVSKRFKSRKGENFIIDGLMFDKLQLAWLRSQMGLVIQEPCFIRGIHKRKHPYLQGRFKHGTNCRFRKSFKCSSSLSGLSPITLSLAKEEFKCQVGKSN